MTTEQEFWERVEAGDPDACWPWLGPIGKGRGIVCSEGRQYLAYRWAYQFTHEVELGRGDFVRHDCGNPICCNPRHLRLKPEQSNADRFWLKVSKDEDGCWRWGGQTHNGYGVFGEKLATNRWKTTRAHLWLWRHMGRPERPGHNLDHLCRTRNCVNPDHLELVTVRENNRRSPTFPGGRTHCPKGHKYDHENTYVPPSGGRQCRACKAARVRDRKKKRRGRRG